MGNKADVVKGLAKRCNENWKVAPTGDIVRFISHPLCFRLCWEIGTVFVRYPRPLDHDDAKFESLREDLVAVALKLSRPDLHRDDGREQPDQRCALEAHRTRYRAHPDELGHRSMGNERKCSRSGNTCTSFARARACCIAYPLQGLYWFASIVAVLACFALVGGYTTYRFMVR